MLNSQSNPRAIIELYGLQTKVVLGILSRYLYGRWTKVVYFLGPIFRINWVNFFLLIRIQESISFRHLLKKQYFPKENE